MINPYYAVSVFEASRSANLVYKQVDLPSLIVSVIGASKVHVHIDRLCTYSLTILMTFCHNTHVLLFRYWEYGTCKYFIRKELLTTRVQYGVCVSGEFLYCSDTF